MAFNRCLICYNKLATSCRETEENHYLPQLLSKSLHNIFILKTVFEVPSEKLEGYLVERGSPSSWKFIRFCERCENDVENVKRIYQEILETSRIFTAVKKAIVTKVRQSWTKFEGKKPLAGGRLDLCSEEISSRIVLEETRKFICEHDYGPSADPFLHGDLLATSLYSFYEQEASQNETMIKVEDDIEDEEISCGEYDELPNDDEADDGEWVVGEVLPLDFALSRPSTSNDFTRKETCTVEIPKTESLPLALSKAKCTTQLHRKRKQSHKVYERKAIPSLSFLQQQAPNISAKSITTIGPSERTSSLHDRVKKIGGKPNKPLPPLKRLASVVSASPPLLTKIKTENSNPNKKTTASKEFLYEQNLLHAPMSSFLQQPQTSNVPLIPFQPPRMKDHRLSASPPATTPTMSPAGFKCDYPECDRVFTKMCMLTDHRRRHTGERPFQCPWEGCTWKFIRKDELTRHYRTHTGDKPYKCMFCTKEFLRSDHRRKHIGSVHKVISQDLSVVQI